MSFLQIASWNIEHLGGTSRGDNKQSAFALADHIEMSGIDLIALQEIYVTPSDDEVRLGEGQPPIEPRQFEGRRNADLDIVCYLLEEHLKEPWAYYIIPNRHSGDKSQLCAVMWNTERLTFDNIRALNVEHTIDGDNLWDRKPHLIEFTTKIKVWRRNDDGEWQQGDEFRRLSIVPLHMKSNFGGVTENRRKRGKEAETLCDALEEIAGEFDPTLILIGDTNILNNAEPAIETFTNQGLIDLNNNDSSTYWSAQFGDSPFDRALIAKDRPEFRYTRQYVMRSSDLVAHDKLLSDHYMIKMSVKDYVDDEDPRPELT